MTILAIESREIVNEAFASIDYGGGTLITTLANKRPGEKVCIVEPNNQTESLLDFLENGEFDEIPVFLRNNGYDMMPSTLDQKISSLYQSYWQCFHFRTGENLRDSIHFVNDLDNLKAGVFNCFFPYPLLMSAEEVLQNGLLHTIPGGKIKIMTENQDWRFEVEEQLEHIGLPYTLNILSERPSGLTVHNSLYEFIFRELYPRPIFQYKITAL